MCRSSWITISVYVLGALRTGQRPGVSSSTFVQTQRRWTRLLLFIVSARRSRGRKWLIKCYLFGEAEAARCSALTGMDEAEKATPRSDPEPCSTGAAAMQKHTAGAHAGRFQGLLMVVQLYRCIGKRAEDSELGKPLARASDKPVSTLARKFACGRRINGGPSIITGNKTVTTY